MIISAAVLLTALYPFDMIYIPSKLNVHLENSSITRIVNAEIGICNCMKIITVATDPSFDSEHIIWNYSPKNVVQK